MKTYRKATDLPLGRLIRGLVGLVIILMAPAIANGVRTQPFTRPWGVVGKLVRNGFFVRAVSTGDHALLQDFLADYWISPRSDEFFDHFEHRFDTLFLRHHRRIVPEIQCIVESFHHQSARLVEIGVGDARVLRYLADHLPSVSHFIGIDLNTDIIETCREKLRADRRFQFHAGDARQWLDAHPAPATILFTNGGVFEYFRRDQLIALLRTARAGGGPCAIAITETLGIDHDLTTDSNSHPYGHEFAFSHNYPAILEEAGFQTRILQDRFTRPEDEHYPERWLQVLGTVRLATD